MLIFKCNKPYVNSPLLPNSSIDTKLGFWNVGLRKYLKFLRQFTKRLKIRVSECCSKLDLQISQIMKKIEIWDF